MATRPRLPTQGNIETFCQRPRVVFWITWQSGRPARSELLVQEVGAARRVGEACVLDHNLRSLSEQPRPHGDGEGQTACAYASLHGHRE